MVLAGSKKNPAFLAPLAGWTDKVFRQICKAKGAAMVYTEMVSAEGLQHGNDRSLTILDFDTIERPVGVQLLVADANAFGKTVPLLDRLQPDCLDLNFGCPVNKVTRKGAGAALLRDPGRMEKLASVAAKMSPVPLTAKMRLADSEKMTLEIALRLQDAGVQAITLHPRTVEMQYSGRARWDCIARLKQVLSIPVIGNGDIRTPLDAKNMIDHTGCDRVMVARGAQGNPWLFERIRLFFGTGSDPGPPEWGTVLEMCHSHCQKIIAHYGEIRGLKIMRKHIVSYIKGMPHASEFRHRIFRQTEWAAIQEQFVIMKKALKSLEFIPEMTSELANGTVPDH
jgi:nifR3 family TIM-barrel protein